MKCLATTSNLDPVGRVVYQAIGERAWDSDEILDKVRALRVKVSNQTDSQSNEAKISIDENKSKS